MKRRTLSQRPISYANFREVRIHSPQVNMQFPRVNVQFPEKFNAKSLKIPEVLLAGLMVHVQVL